MAHIDIDLLVNGILKLNSVDAKDLEKEAGKLVAAALQSTKIPKALMPVKVGVEFDPKEFRADVERKLKELDTILASELADDVRKNAITARDFVARLTKLWDTQTLKDFGKRPGVIQKTYTEIAKGMKELEDVGSPTKLKHLRDFNALLSQQIGLLKEMNRALMGAGLNKLSPAGMQQGRGVFVPQLAAAISVVEAQTTSAFGKAETRLLGAPARLAKEKEKAVEDAIKAQQQQSVTLKKLAEADRLSREKALNQKIKAREKQAAQDIQEENKKKDKERRAQETIDAQQDRAYTASVNASIRAGERASQQAASQSRRDTARRIREDRQKRIKNQAERTRQLYQQSSFGARDKALDILASAGGPEHLTDTAMVSQLLKETQGFLRGKVQSYRLTGDTKGLNLARDELVAVESLISDVRKRQVHLNQAPVLQERQQVQAQRSGNLRSSYRAMTEKLRQSGLLVGGGLGNVEAVSDIGQLQDMLAYAEMRRKLGAPRIAQLMQSGLTDSRRASLVGLQGQYNQLPAAIKKRIRDLETDPERVAAQARAEEARLQAALGQMDRRGELDYQRDVSAHLSRSNAERRADRKNLNARRAKQRYHGILSESGYAALGMIESAGGVENIAAGDLPHLIALLKEALTLYRALHKEALQSGNLSVSNRTRSDLVYLESVMDSVLGRKQGIGAAIRKEATDQRVASRKADRKRERDEAAAIYAQGVAGIEGGVGGILAQAGGVSGLKAEQIPEVLLGLRDAATYYRRKRTEAINANDVATINSAGKALEFYQRKIDEVSKHQIALAKSTREAAKAIDDQKEAAKATEEQAKRTTLLGLGKDVYEAAGGRMGRVSKANLPAVIEFLKERKSSLTGQLPGLANDGEAYHKAATELVNYSHALDDATARMKGFRGIAHQVQTTLGMFARYAVGYGALYQVLDAVVALGKGITDLQDKFISIKAIAQATDDEMSSVTGAITRLGKEFTSQFSSQEIAEAAKILAQAGVAPQEISKSLRSVAMFASATESSLENAADVMTTMKEVFGEMDDAKTADMLTKAVNISKLNADSLGTIVSRGAQTAREFGLSAEQFLSAAAVLRNAGLKESTIATNFRQALIDMMSPDERTIAILQKRYRKLGEDLTGAQVRARFMGMSQSDNPLLDVLREYQRLGLGGSGFMDFSKAFNNVEARNAIQALVSNIDDLEKSFAALAGGGSAVRGAETQMESFSKSMSKLGSVFVTVGASMAGGFLDKMAALAHWLGENLAQLDKLGTSLDTGKGSGFVKFLKERFTPGAALFAGGDLLSGRSRNEKIARVAESELADIEDKKAKELSRYRPYDAQNPESQARLVQDSKKALEQIEDQLMSSFGVQKDQLPAVMSALNKLASEGLDAGSAAYKENLAKLAGPGMLNRNLNPEQVRRLEEMGSAVKGSTGTIETARQDLLKAVAYSSVSPSNSAFNKILSSKTGVVSSDAALQGTLEGGSKQVAEKLLELYSSIVDEGTKAATEGVNGQIAALKSLKINGLIEKILSTSGDELDAALQELQQTVGNNMDEIAYTIKAVEEHIAVPMTGGMGNLSAYLQRTKTLARTRQVLMLSLAGARTQANQANAGVTDEWNRTLQQMSSASGDPAVAALLKRTQGTPYEGLIQRYSVENDLDPDFVRAIMMAESSGNPRAVSNKGAQGLMQLMPGTASRYRVVNSFDPEQNIKGGTRYLADLKKMFGGNTDLMAAAYNAGENNVIKYGRRIPPFAETQAYVQRVQAYQKKKPAFSPFVTNPDGTLSLSPEAKSIQDRFKALAERQSMEDQANAEQILAPYEQSSALSGAVERARDAVDVARKKKDYASLLSKGGLLDQLRAAQANANADEQRYLQNRINVGRDQRFIGDTAITDTKLKGFENDKLRFEQRVAKASSDLDKLEQEINVDQSRKLVTDQLRALEQQVAAAQKALDLANRGTNNESEVAKRTQELAVLKEKQVELETKRDKLDNNDYAEQEAQSRRAANRADLSKYGTTEFLNRLQRGRDQALRALDRPEDAAAVAMGLGLTPERQISLLRAKRIINAGSLERLRTRVGLWQSQPDFQTSDIYGPNSEAYQSATEQIRTLTLEVAKLDTELKQLNMTFAEALVQAFSSEQLRAAFRQVFGTLPDMVRNISTDIAGSVKQIGSTFIDSLMGLNQNVSESSTTSNGLLSTTTSRIVEGWRKLRKNERWSNFNRRADLYPDRGDISSDPGSVYIDAQGNVVARTTKTTTRRGITTTHARRVNSDQLIFDEATGTVSGRQSSTSRTTTRTKSPYSQIGRDLVGNVLKHMYDGAVSVLSDKMLVQPFTQMFKGWFRSLVSMFSETMATSLFGGATGSGSTGIASAVTGATSSSSFWTAGIGSLFAGVLKDGGVLSRFSSGGIISGPGTSTSDSIPALLTSGGKVKGMIAVSNREAILNAAATRALGPGFINAINHAALKGYATGGLLGSSLSQSQVGGYNGPPVDVQIYDQRKASSPDMEVKRSKDLLNREVISVVVRDEMKKHISSGGLDRDLKMNAGTRRPGIPR